MLLGEYRHTLDDKNRVSLPAKFRKILGKKIIITRGLDRCLSVYSMAEWKKFFSETLAELSGNQATSRAFTRYKVAGATEVDVDSAGRIRIPDLLKHYGNLGARIVVAGVGSSLELWNEEAWDAYTKNVEGTIESLAENIDSANK